MKSRRFVFGLLLLALSACQLLPSDERQQEAGVWHAKLGLAYLKRGDRVLARQHLVIALQEAPRSAMVNASMAYMMEQTGDVKTADVLYHKALALAPGQSAYLHDYAAFLCRGRHYQRAMHYFALASRDAYYKHRALVYENAGVCALAQGNKRLARYNFNKALQNDPSRQRALLELKNLSLRG